MLNEETKKEIDEEIEEFYDSEDSGSGLGEDTVDNLDQLEELIAEDEKNASSEGKVNEEE
jgi:hypothetical protein